jgi:hypothetical protein
MGRRNRARKEAKHVFPPLQGEESKKISPKKRGSRISTYAPTGRGEIDFDNTNLREKGERR